MNVVQFLEYLHERTATADLAESLAQVFSLRGRVDLVPAEFASRATQRVAS